MSTFFVTTNTKSEERLLSEMLKKMRFKAKVLSDEEKEDIGLFLLMREADRTKIVSRESVMAKLGRK